MDLIANKTAALTITQVKKAKNFSNVEKVNCIKGLKFLRINGARADQITIGRYSQNRKHLRENEKDTMHQFDIRHC